MRVLERGIGRGTQASTGNLQQPQPQCREAVPGDVMQQGEGCWGGSGHMSCLKQNFTVFRHCCHQEQQGGRWHTTWGSGGNRGSSSFRQPAASSAEVAGGSALEDVGKAPSGQPLWSAEASCVFARHTTEPAHPWKSKFGACEMPAHAQERCIQGCSYPPVLDGFSSHIE